MADYMTRHTEFMAAIRDNDSYQASIADAIRAGADLGVTGGGQYRNFIVAELDIGTFGPVGVKVSNGVDPLLSLISRKPDTSALEVAMYAAVSSQFDGVIRAPVAGVVKANRRHYVVSQDLSSRGTSKLEKLPGDSIEDVEYNWRVWKGAREVVEMRKSDNQLFFVDGKNPTERGEALAQQYLPHILDNIVELN